MGIPGFGLEVWGLWVGVWDPTAILRVESVGLRVGLRVQGSGFRIKTLGVGVRCFSIEDPSTVGPKPGIEPADQKVPRSRNQTLSAGPSSA